MLSCSSACCRGVVVAWLVAWSRVVLWLLASACVVAVRAGMEAKDSDLWLLAVRCAVRLCCGRDACQVGAGSVGRVTMLCVRQWVGGWCGSSWVNQPRAGWGQPRLLCVVMAASELMGARVCGRQGPFAAWRRADALCVCVCALCCLLFIVGFLGFFPFVRARALCVCCLVFCSLANCFLPSSLLFHLHLRVHRVLVGLKLLGVMMMFRRALAPASRQLVRQQIRTAVRRPQPTRRFSTKKVDHQPSSTPPRGTPAFKGENWVSKIAGEVKYLFKKYVAGKVAGVVAGPLLAGLWFWRESEGYITSTMVDTFAKGVDGLTPKDATVSVERGELLTSLRTILAPTEITNYVVILGEKGVGKSTAVRQTLAQLESPAVPYTSWHRNMVVPIFWRHSR